SYTGDAAAEAFIESQLGWSFPVGSTRFWLLGLLDTRYPGRELFNAEGQLAGLEQHGWTITFKRFVAADAQLLPGSLVMDHAEGQIRVAIHQWEL
ncbi:MAG: lipoprotein insertase outer membrane protein LolB, partial [Gammaproteobacteria bacterium]